MHLDLRRPHPPPAPTSGKRQRCLHTALRRRTHRACIAQGCGVWRGHHRCSHSLLLDHQGRAQHHGGGAAQGGGCCIRCGGQGGWNQPAACSMSAQESTVAAAAACLRNGSPAAWQLPSCQRWQALQPTHHAQPQPSPTKTTPHAQPQPSPTPAHRQGRRLPGAGLERWQPRGQAGAPELPHARAAGGAAGGGGHRLQAGYHPAGEPTWGGGGGRPPCRWAAANQAWGAGKRGEGPWRGGGGPVGAEGARGCAALPGCCPCHVHHFGGRFSR